ncbi:sodium:solute symporter family protein [candidate division KSB1 bacterium]|nr:sodium:solute symporter family protein [candidate division KSB1 bacterium]
MYIIALNGGAYFIIFSIRRTAATDREQIMFGLATIDIIVIMLYFMILLVIGLRAMLHIKNQEDYFLGGRQFGKLVQTFSTFGQATSSDTAIGTTTTTFHNGASGIWSALMMLWTTPLYWFTSTWYRRMRVITMGDFFQERYGSWRMAAFYALISSLFLMTHISMGFKALSATAVAVTPKPLSELTREERLEYKKTLELEQLRQTELNPEQQQRLQELELQKPKKLFSYLREDILIWSLCLIIFLYTIAGGLEAAMYTDMLQGVFIMFLSIALIPFGLLKISSLYNGRGMLDGFKIMHERLPESFFDIFGSITTIDFTWYYIIAVSIMAAINVAVQANQMTVNAAARDEFAARFGFVSGAILKRFFTVLWGAFALIAVVLYADKLQNSDYLWGYATRDLLGGLGIGLVGLMMASLLAALMSTADTLMLSCSSLLTHNLYRPLRPNLNEQHYVLIGRISGAIILIGGALFSTLFDSILQMLKFIWEFNAPLAASFWCGIKWRRANRQGAWTSILISMLLFAAIPILAPVVYPSLKTTSSLLLTTDPQPITRIYQAKEIDVEERNKKISQWDILARMGQAKGLRPVAIEKGEQIRKTIQPPRKAIFWSKGLSSSGDKITGSGLLYIEMVILNQFIDLTKNPHALNETIRTGFRIIIPFLLLIFVSLFTGADDEERLKRFYAKMRTPVHADRPTDEKELKKSVLNPDRFKHRLLFPGSNLEFFKWNRQDSAGFLASIAAITAILALFWFILSIGS